MKPQVVHLHIRQLALDAPLCAGGTPLSRKRAAHGITLQLDGPTLSATSASTAWQQAVARAVSQRLVAMGVLTHEQLAAAVAEQRTPP
jgi:hypothetical protein